jgi:hypothetical protein
MENVVIDPSWTPVEGQEGLYVETRHTTNFITGLPMIVRILHSADGYCFYDLADEYYDEEGNRIPESEVPAEMRMYYQWMSIPEIKNIEDFVSVPVQPGFEIAN